MAAFSALSTSQQNQVITYVSSIFRPNVGALARLLNTFAAMDSVWQNNVLALIQALDAGTVIPDNTSLAGAAPLTSTTMLSLMTSVEAILSTYNTGAVRGTYGNVAGLTNIT